MLYRKKWISSNIISTNYPTYNNKHFLPHHSKVNYATSFFDLFQNGEHTWRETFFRYAQEFILLLFFLCEILTGIELLYLEVKKTLEPFIQV